LCGYRTLVASVGTRSHTHTEVFRSSSTSASLLCAINRGAETQIPPKQRRRYTNVHEKSSKPTLLSLSLAAAASLPPPPPPPAQTRLLLLYCRSTLQPHSTWHRGLCNGLNTRNRPFSPLSRSQPLFYLFACLPLSLFLPSCVLTEKNCKLAVAVECGAVLCGDATSLLARSLACLPCLLAPSRGFAS
jgi:hypothetical protein